MIRRVYTALAREVVGVHQAAYVLAAFSLLSSLLALVRDRLLAHLFGAGHALDLYYAAFRIPDLLFVAIGSMVSVYALIPVLVSRTEKEQQKTFDSIFLAFFGFSAVASAVLMVVAPFILPLFFPELAARHLDELVLLTRILLLQPILLGLSNVLASITQLRQRYVIYAISPLVYNIGIICGALFIYPTLGLASLAWGVVLGAVGHAAIQLPWILREGYLRRMPTTGKARALWEAAKTSFPRSVALSFGQVTSLILVAIAGGLAPGSITIFMLASNLQSVPLTLVGASYSVAAFPTLARMAVEGRTDAFVVHLVTISRHIILWSVPAAAFAIILRAHIVRVILGSGAFDWTDTRLTAAALALFMLSVPLHGLVLLLLRSYYAVGIVRMPLIATGASTIIAVISGYALTYLFAASQPFRFFIEALLRIEDIPGTTISMLPLAYTIGIATSACILIIDIERRFGGFVRGILRVVGESVSAAVIGAAIAYGILGILGDSGPTDTLLEVFGHAFAAGVAGILGVYVVLTFLGSRELEEALRALGERVWKVAPVASAEEER